MRLSGSLALPLLAAALAAMWETGPLLAVRGTLRAVLDRLWLAAAGWLADKPGEPCAWCPDPGDIADDDLDLDELAERLADRGGEVPVEGPPISAADGIALAAILYSLRHESAAEPHYPAREDSDG
jgi:hypothetical protein